MSTRRADVLFYFPNVPRGVAPAVTVRYAWDMTTTSAPRKVVSILAGHAAGQTAPVLSVDSDGVHELQLPSGAISYYDEHEVDDVDPVALCRQALMDLAGSLPVAELLAQLRVAQGYAESRGVEDPAAAKAEAAMSYLQLALEAAGR